MNRNQHVHRTILVVLVLVLWSMRSSERNEYKMSVLCMAIRLFT